MLRAGDVVRVLKAFRSADDGVQISLPAGCKGVVDSVDDDGDALVSFPALTGVQCCVRWVLKDSFTNLSVYDTPGLPHVAGIPLAHARQDSSPDCSDAQKGQT